MRNISEIYQEYKIMPNLERHQLRVAAVARQICDSVDESIDGDAVVRACLLHDMGNIIKFQLHRFPHLIEGDDGVQYWEKVQQEFIALYGTDEHEATIKIARDLGVDKKTLAIITSIEFNNWSQIKESGGWEDIISAYADSRVAPYGVISLDDRLEDARKRYEGISHEADQIREELYESMRLIEKRIFASSNISPEDISDASILELLETVKNFQI